MRRLLCRPERGEPLSTRRTRAVREEQARAESEGGANGGVRAKLPRSGLERVAVARREVMLDVLLGERGEVGASVRAEERERIGGHGEMVGERERERGGCRDEPQ
jgi:hypothetical protein